MEQVPLCIQATRRSPAASSGAAHHACAPVSKERVGSMKTFELEKINDVREMVAAAHATARPVVVYDGADEALVAMSPAVFERFLTDGAILAATDRSTFRL